MKKSVVSIVMGSKSDLETVQEAIGLLKEFKIDFEVKVLSAHRTPKELARYVEDASRKGVQVFIAAAGGAAALAGVIASHTTLPVIGVPIETSSLKGMDSLLSTVQMPKGIPVACVAIGKAGAYNAGILAVQILALHDQSLMGELARFKKKLSQKVLAEKISL